MAVYQVCEPDWVRKCTFSVSLFSLSLSHHLSLFLSCVWQSVCDRGVCMCGYIHTCTPVNTENRGRHEVSCSLTFGHIQGASLNLERLQQSGVILRSQCPIVLCVQVQVAFPVVWKAMGPQTSQQAPLFVEPSPQPLRSFGDSCSWLMRELWGRFGVNWAFWEGEA